MGLGRAAKMLVVGLIIVVLAACGGTSSNPNRAQPPTSAPTTSPTSSAPPTSAERTATTPTTVPCTNQKVIDTWPIARRAAAVLVPPVLNFDMANAAAASRAGVGGLLLLGNSPPPPNFVAELRAALANASSPLVPIVMVDQEGGGIQRLAGAVTSMPWAREMGQTMSPAQIRSLAATVGRQMVGLGVKMDLAPVLDVDGGVGPNTVDPDGSRSFSAVASIAARDGVAFMQGLQDAGVIPVAKHFPGLGGATGNTDDRAAATPPLRTLQTSGLVPFRAAIAAGAPAIMVANASVPGLTALPASLSSAAITGLLRQQLGFQGLVLTDSLSAVAITQAGYTLSQAVVAAVAAGADMVLFSSTLTPSSTVAGTVQQLVEALVQAVQAGTISPTRLDGAVAHIARAEHLNLCG